jgi:hypothetical protein
MQSLNNRIKLLPAQIPQQWELIKFVVVRVDEVNDKDLQPYLNELLHVLLNGKAQCFLGLSEKRNITGVWITRLMIDKITGEKYLFAQILYSFKFVDDESRKQEIDFIKEFARKEKAENKKLILLKNLPEKSNVRIFLSGHATKEFGKLAK